MRARPHAAKGSMLRRSIAATCAALVVIVGYADLFPRSSHAQETPTVRIPPPQQPPAPPPANEVNRYTLSHERYEKAVAYSRAGYALYFLSAFIGLAVLLFVLRTGFAGRI